MKWLEGLGDTVKETVVELKRLLNMELHNSIELSQDLQKPFFQITTFHFGLMTVSLSHL
jgi:hypothetical protein